MFLLTLTLTLFIVQILSQQYNLSSGIKQQLNITAGLQLSRLQVYNEYLYCLANNQTHFQFLAYNSKEGYLLMEGSPVFEGQLPEEISQSSEEPSLSIIDSSKLMLIYRPNNLTQTHLVLADIGNLSSYQQIIYNFSFTGKYISRLGSYFLKGEENQWLIEDFPFANNRSLTYSYSQASNKITDYLVLKSINEIYLATIDKPNGVICLTQIRYNYNGTLNSTQTDQIYIGTPIIGACLHLDYTLFLQTNDTHLYKLHLSTLTLQTLNLTYNATKQCYFDPVSNSLMLIQNTNNVSKAIVQLSLSSNMTTDYVLLATNLLYLNDYVFYLADIDVLSSFQTTSCQSTYDPIILKCDNCKVGCSSCNGSLLCNTCSTSFILDQYGSSYSRLYYNCASCPANCHMCNSSSTCTLCNQGYVLTSSYRCNQSSKNEQTALDSLMNALGNITAITNMIPSARSLLKPLLYVLISFDDLFPYMFHERNYGKTIQSLFISIYKSETEKWSTYDKLIINPIFELIGVNKESMLNSMDSYYDYSSPTFIRWEENGQSVLISAFSFFTTNFLVSLFLFFIFRVLFKLLFRYRVSLIFRPESFWCYFSFFVMEGNLQVVTFYACSILRLNFYFNLSQKAKAAVVYFGLYFLIFLGIAGYFLVFSKLRNLCKYFTQNLKPSFAAMVFLTIECGVKNILLAMIHSLFRASSLYALQFGCLALVELMCIVNYLVYLNRDGCFELKAKVWIYLLLSSVRLVMISFLFVQQGSLDDEATLLMVDQACSVILTINMLVVMVSLIMNLLFSVREAVIFVKNCITRPMVMEKQKGKQQEESNKDDSRVQNQKKMMRVYFQNKAIKIKHPREYKKKEDYLKVTIKKSKQT